MPAKLGPLGGGKRHDDAVSSSDDISTDSRARDVPKRTTTSIIGGGIAGTLPDGSIWGGGGVALEDALTMGEVRINLH